MEAYSNHYNLRTSPEDWWYTIIQTVALAIDKSAKKLEVQKFFNKHDGKVITVDIGGSFNGFDYSWLFDQIAEQIALNINKPEYAQAMDQNFSSSNKVHKIVSRVALMKSVKEYFDYKCFLECGIPAIEMKGTEADWIKLGSNIKAVKKLLQPIHDAINLKESWWIRIEQIANKLLNTFNDNPDADWWSKIITERSFDSGAPELRGWFMVDLLNVPNAFDISDAPSGIVTVPMTITDGNDVEDSAIVTGMVGYKFHNETHSVEPIHGWSLLLKQNSTFRNEIIIWEEMNNSS